MGAPSLMGNEDAVVGRLLRCGLLRAAWDCLDILAVLKGGVSYDVGGRVLSQSVSVGSCCWRPWGTAHFTGEPGVSRP